MMHNQPEDTKRSYKPTIMSILEINAKSILPKPPHPQMLPFFQKMDQTVPQFFTRMLPLRQYLDEVSSQIKSTFTGGIEELHGYKHKVTTTMNWI